ncbi:Uncharacterised protein [Candidatus Bilamarchaeum dharawalense]|uniref:Uncharacterized protein n=1 Tax=Candidatus Bilamarchaeum dharawalense TaxID=2885759 RepID=A0A5E4LPB4_9ARCH|nr:Uncharacterised protein [Candidatus Bilamarchaeum dharawalense]
MCPEKQMKKGDATTEAVKEEISSSLGPRGMSIDQMMGRPEIKKILTNAKNPGEARSKVTAFLAKRGLLKDSKSTTQSKDQKK